MDWIPSFQAQTKKVILAQYLNTTTILDLKLVLSLSLDCSEKWFFHRKIKRAIENLNYLALQPQMIQYQRENCH